MAKIVVAGCSDCPYFAKVELLAEKVSINVPNFEVHKIVKNRKEWKEWVNELTTQNHWNIKESPIIWRELVDRGGKGHLIGGANEFQEYIKCYYDISSDFTSEHMQNIAIDNVRFKNEEDKENREFKAMSTPTKVCICGAANNIVPHFVLRLARGDIIDNLTELSIVFLDKEESLPFLKTLQMGAFDLAYPLVRSISITEDCEAAFADSSYVIIFDDVYQLPNESMELWLKRCQETYEYYGNVLEKYCPSNVKVLMVPDGSDNLININLMCMHRMLDRIPKFNVVGLSRPFEQHARSIIAKKLSVNPSNVHSIIVWGNIGGKKVFDISNCEVHKYDGSIVGPEPFSLPAEKTIWDKKWLRNEMENLIQERFSQISELRGVRGSPLGVANAVSTFMKQWINGDKKGHIHSLVVASEGRYGVPNGMVFSMPVTLNPKGYWTVIQDAEMTEKLYKNITECIEDINEKLMVIYPWMNNNQADVVLDEMFIDSQLQSLLEEVYPKERFKELQNLLNDNLSLEDKLDVSKSKELLLRTISDLEKLEKTFKTEPEKNDVNISANDKVALLIDNNNNNNEDFKGEGVIKPKDNGNENENEND